jgi:CheY-like chemotaxis protein
MRKILVVDDTVDARDVLARLLRLGGFSTVTAEDGYEALKALEMDNPDLVLLDLMMPRMNGVELLETMRQDPRWKNVPVMLLTAVSDGPLITDAARLGVQDFILKGAVSGLSLLERVARTLQRAPIQ